jgi:hypothetical protein
MVIVVFTGKGLMHKTKEKIYINQPQVIENIEIYYLSGKNTEARIQIKANKSSGLQI